MDASVGSDDDDDVTATGKNRRIFLTGATSKVSCVTIVWPWCTWKGLDGKRGGGGQKGGS